MILRSSSPNKLISLAALICLSLPLAAEARNQWEIQHPEMPQGQDGALQPGQMPGQLHKGIPQQMTQPKYIGKGFWQGNFSGTVNRVAPGVVLTGVLEDEISSGANKPGDVFALNLEQGYVQNDMQVIPKGSKIVGAITHVIPAKMQRGGAPGSVQISLQSLVLPDGTHLPFGGFISHNPNHAYENPHKKRNLGFDIKDTGHHIAGMMGSFTNGVGFMYAKKYRGKEFYMDKGESMPIKVNRAVTIPEQYIKPVETAAAPQNLNAPNITGMPGGQLPPQMVPGLQGQDTIGQYQAPPPVQPVPGLVGEGDPFNAPVNPAASSKSLNDMPEPF